jgi:hypothetical protein
VTKNAPVLPTATVAFKPRTDFVNATSSFRSHEVTSTKAHNPYVLYSHALPTATLYSHILLQENRGSERINAM